MSPVFYSVVVFESNRFIASEEHGDPDSSNFQCTYGSYCIIDLEKQTSFEVRVDLQAMNLGQGGVVLSDKMLFVCLCASQAHDSLLFRRPVKLSLSSHQFTAPKNTHTAIPLLPLCAIVSNSTMHI